MDDARRRLIESLIQTHDQLVQNESRLLDALIASGQASTDARRDNLPSIREWRTYQGFRSDMQHREREWLRHNDGPIPKLALSNQTGGDSVRTISRIMQRRYHLDPDRDWPPSTWPEQEPPALGGLGHQLAALVAGTGGLSMLDVVSDGRLDHIVKMCKLLLGAMSGHV